MINRRSMATLVCCIVLAAAPITGIAAWAGGVHGPMHWAAIAVMSAAAGIILWLCLYLVFLVATQPPRSVVTARPRPRRRRRE